MVICPRCQANLPEGAHFCDQCGLRLVDPAGFSWWRKQDAEQVSTPKVEEFVGPAPDRTSPASEMTVPPAPTAPPAPPDATPAKQLAPPASQAGESQLHQYIPRELLSKLETARQRGEMVGERRVVTMLFCDVLGSTAAAEHLDPEEWTEIINGAFEYMIRPVYKYEGTLARLMGDGILAFFGAPIAHEDDAQRAVLTGLDIVNGIKQYRSQIKQRYKLDLNVRVGINTGMVVVGAVGSDLRMEYTALGDAINLAARMEQTAAPGTVQIAHDTYKVVKPLFEFEDLGSIEIKGKTETIQAYRVLERKYVAGHVRGIEGLQVELVGRQAELQTLNQVMMDLKQGVGRIVCVLGEAGIGKSRLVSEIQRTYKQQVGSDAYWFETASLSYETTQAYGLFQRLIRRICGINHDDAPILMRNKLATLIDSQGEQVHPGAMRLFEALLGLESENGGLHLEGEEFRQELLATMRSWWRGQFSGWPTVLVFEDMHWSDQASVSLLHQLFQFSEEIPLVLICVMRNERQAPAWQIRSTADEEFRHRYTEISLHPLSEEESNELLNRLLAVADLPENLRASVIEKSAGNPYFIEEVVRTLIDSGTVVAEMRQVEGEMVQYWRATSDGADFDIPDNLQSLFAARIDRLEEPTRATLQIASVIGRTFYRRVLQAVDEASLELDKQLTTLLRLDMIREAARMPELEYAFRNPMTQEAVYNTILLKRRRQFHLRVAEVMEALYADRLDALYGLLAHHFALGNESERAIEYYRLAARQAAELYAYDDAIQNLRRAVEFVDPDGNGEIHLILLEELGDVYRSLRDGEQAIEQYQRGLDRLASMTTPDSQIEMRLHCKIVEVVGEIKWSVGLEYLQRVYEARQRSRAWLEESLATRESEAAQVETVRVLTALSTDAWRIQDPPDWEAAQRFAMQAVDIARQLNSPVDLSQALGALATVLDGRSLLSEHLEVTGQRLEICTQAEFKDGAERIDALRNMGAALMYVGEYEQAIVYLEEAERHAQEARLVFQQANSIGLLAQCLFRLDRWDEVLATEELWRDLEQRYSRERVGET